MRYREVEDPYAYYDNPYAQMYGGGQAVTGDPVDPGGMPGSEGNPNTGYPPPSPSPVPMPQPTSTAPVSYSDAAFQAILRKYPPTKAGVQQAVAEANKTFGTAINVLATTGGEKVRLPDGRVIDTIIGVDGASPQWAWQDTADSGGRANGPLDFNAVSLDPSFLEPWTGRAPQGDLPTFVEPGAFQAPTAEDVYKDPSYQFRLDQGRGMIENSAAAKGVLNSGGTLHDILNYGQKAASQEYGNVFDRAFGLWNSNWNNALTAFRAKKDVSDSAYNRAWNAYIDARDTHFRNQNEPFNKLYSVAQLGVNAAGA